MALNQPPQPPYDARIRMVVDALPTCAPPLIFLSPSISFYPHQAYLKQNCPMPAIPSKGNIVECSNCSKALRYHDEGNYLKANCSKLQENYWCLHHGKQKTMLKKNFPIFELPTKNPSECFEKNGSYDAANCAFDAMSGMMWSQRLNQFLLANGIALLMVTVPSPILESSAKRVWKLTC